MSTRIVLTRIDDDGKARHVEQTVESVVQAVDPTNPVMQAGKTYTTVWGTGGPDAPRIGPGISPSPERTPFFPPPGGTRLVYFTLPPTSSSADDAPTDVRTTEIAGLSEVFDDDSSGMHATDTIDYAVLIDGEITLELDDGVLIELHKGDCVVQQGTRHAWRNYGTGPATLIAFTFGAVRVE